LFLEPLREFAQVMKEKPVIRLGKETRLAVIATLDDVDGKSRYLQALASCHAAFNGHPWQHDDSTAKNQLTPMNLLLFPWGLTPGYFSKVLDFVSS
jgi:hypothetical protein